MAEKNSELGVVRVTRDGRRRYDEGAKRALVERALSPGVSVARLAQEHGVNANLLRKWITKHLMQREAPAVVPQEVRTIDMIEGVSIDMPARNRVVPPEPAFIPVVAASKTPVTMSVQNEARPAMTMAIALHVRLPNGVEFDLGEASADELATVIQMLGRLPCSGSTKG
nr:transposase [Burkholderia gladioli]